jgi:hypothetical protein
MHKNNRIRSLVLLSFLTLFSPIIVFGQNTEQLCRAFINRAFGDMANNCANLAADEACYAYGNFGEVISTFYVDGTARVVQEDVFVEASERVSLLDMEELTSLESLETGEFVLDSDRDSEDENQWGLALLEVPANLPQQFEQNAAVYLVLGGARIENAVYPENSIKLNDAPVVVSVNADTSVFGSPDGLAYPIPDDVIGTASGTLEADGISPDGNWLRVFFSYERQFGARTTAWIRVEDLVEAGDFEALPVMGPESNTAMQSFYLSNSFSRPECAQVPAAGLLVQGPGEIETDFTLNNMPVRVTSTAYFRQVSEQRLQVFALTGFTILFPDSDDASVIPEGFTQVLCLTEEQDLGIDGQINDRAIDSNCPEGGPRSMTGDELAGLAGFANLPNNILNYAIVLPRVICPSGVGTPDCFIVPASRARIEIKCEEGRLPEAVCERFNF